MYKCYNNICNCYKNYQYLVSLDKQQINNIIPTFLINNFHRKCIKHTFPDDGCMKLITYYFNQIDITFNHIRKFNIFCKNQKHVYNIFYKYVAPMIANNIVNVDQIYDNQNEYQIYNFTLKYIDICIENVSWFTKNIGSQNKKNIFQKLLNNDNFHLIIPHIFQMGYIPDYNDILLAIKLNKILPKFDCSNIICDHQIGELAVKQKIFEYHKILEYKYSEKALEIACKTNKSKQIIHVCENCDIVPNINHLMIYCNRYRIKIKVLKYFVEICGIKFDKECYEALCKTSLKSFRNIIEKMDIHTPLVCVLDKDKIQNLCKKYQCKYMNMKFQSDEDQLNILINNYTSNCCYCSGFFSELVENNYIESINESHIDKLFKISKNKFKNICNKIRNSDNILKDHYKIMTHAFCDKMTYDECEKYFINNTIHYKYFLKYFIPKNNTQDRNMYIEKKLQDIVTPEFFESVAHFINYKNFMKFMDMNVQVTQKCFRQLLKGSIYVFIQYWHYYLEKTYIPTRDDIFELVKNNIYFINVKKYVTMDNEFAEHLVKYLNWNNSISTCYKNDIRSQGINIYTKKMLLHACENNNISFVENVIKHNPRIIDTHCLELICLKKWGRVIIDDLVCKLKIIPNRQCVYNYLQINYFNNNDVLLYGLEHLE